VPLSVSPLQLCLWDATWLWYAASTLKENPAGLHMPHNISTRIFTVWTKRLWTLPIFWHAWRGKSMLCWFRWNACNRNRHSLCTPLFNYTLQVVWLGSPTWEKWVLPVRRGIKVPWTTSKLHACDNGEDSSARCNFHAQFSCAKLRAFELYDGFWEAVEWLERCGFNALACTCDGFSVNSSSCMVQGTSLTTIPQYGRMAPHREDCMNCVCEGSPICAWTVHVKSPVYVWTVRVLRRCCQFS